jgi:hypothetical protein
LPPPNAKTTVQKSAMRKKSLVCNASTIIALSKSIPLKDKNIIQGNQTQAARVFKKIVQKYNPYNESLVAKPKNVKKTKSMLPTILSLNKADLFHIYAMLEAISNVFDLCNSISSNAIVKACGTSQSGVATMTEDVKILDIEASIVATTRFNDVVGTMVDPPRSSNISSNLHCIGSMDTISPIWIADCSKSMALSTFVADQKPTSATKQKPKKVTRDSKKKWRRFIKKNCQVSISVKTLLLDPNVTKMTIVNARHVNCDGLVIHGELKAGEHCAHFACFSLEMRNFISQCLHLPLAPLQIMAKHIHFLKSKRAARKEITQDLIVTTQDIWNVIKELSKETYMLHQNDAQSVRMWRQRNPNDVFYYRKICAFVARELNSQNMSFTLRIQTSW